MEIKKVKKISYMYNFLQKNNYKFSLEALIRVRDFEKLNLSSNTTKYRLMEKI